MVLTDSTLFCVPVLLVRVVRWQHVCTIAGALLLSATHLLTLLILRLVLAPPTLTFFMLFLGSIDYSVCITYSRICEVLVLEKYCFRNSFRVVRLCIDSVGTVVFR